VIAHVVLFTPKPSLTPAERRALVADLEQACRDIPQIRRSRIGRRKRMGYAYDAVGSLHFEFLAVLEFDSRQDLDTYLQHPSHAALGRWFHHGAELAIAHDFEMVDAEGLRGIVTDYTEG
jgi:stress responsive alpha/beta barrel protein